MTTTEPALKQPAWIQVEKLEPSTENVNVIVKVCETFEIINQKKADGTYNRITEALVGDSTGSIIFTAKGDEVELLRPDVVLEVVNGKIEVFQGFMRLVSAKYGNVAKSTKSVGEVNIKNNLSNTEYERVHN